MRKLYDPVTVSNAICFFPDRRFGYYTDTPRQIVWRQPLNEVDGWPLGEPVNYLDFTTTKIFPDGAVCDVDGYLWNAQWGSARIARYSPEGALDKIISLPADHITCPAFGGRDLRDLFATSAIEGLGEQWPADQPLAGNTFVTPVDIAGQKEHQVIL